MNRPTLIRESHGEWWVMNHPSWGLDIHEDDWCNGIMVNEGFGITFPEIPGVDQVRAIIGDRDPGTVTREEAQAAIDAVYGPCETCEGKGFVFTGNYPVEPCGSCWTCARCGRESSYQGHFGVNDVPYCPSKPCPECQ